MLSSSSSSKWTRQYALYCTLAISLLTRPAASYWVFNHGALGLDARLDPIISPGAVSGHAHSFVGSNAVGASQTNISIQSSSACTTAAAQADKSSYWTPTLYQYYDGAFEALPLGSVNTYYLQRGNMSLQAFPPGLRMIAGDASARGSQNTTQLQNVVSFVCLNFNTGSSQTQIMPNGTCPDGLRAQIVFPSCWDGVNLDSSDHKSHMSYPLGNFADNGDECPSTHPIRFITLFYEYVWSTGQINGSNLVFANGDAIGYAYHGDFMNGWDTTVLQDAIDQCTGQLGGDDEACPPFVPSINRTTAAHCKVNVASVQGLSSEQVDGKIPNLPGCNSIFNGPLAGVGSCGSNGTDASNTASSMPDGYHGCYAEPSSGLRALPYAASGGNSMTIESCRSACTAQGYPVAGMEYASQCYCGSQFSYGTLLMLDDDCSMACAGNSSEICGAGNRLSVYSDMSTISTASAPPSAPASIGSSFQYLGCYSDLTSNRTFPSRKPGTDLESCASSCSGFEYFGMEYADECYCGNLLNVAQLADSSCNMICSSNSTELCGGPNALTVYQNTSLAGSQSSSSNVPTSTTSSSPATTVVASSSPTSSLTSTSTTSTTSTPTSLSSATPSSTLLAGTQSIGCYVDGNPRSLLYTAYSNTSNTPSVCAATCRAKGYQYSGTEYSRECYCSNYLLNSAASGPVQDGCNMPCSGDSTRMCGGSNRLSIVQDNQWVPTVFTVQQTGKWNFTDCIVDSPQKRVLSKSLSVSNNTPESCLAACQTAKLPYCGMEYAGECYGSKEAPTVTSAPSIGNDDPIARGCSMPCSGNSTVVCGGSNRLNLYTYLGKNAISVSPSVLVS